MTRKLTFGFDTSGAASIDAVGVVDTEAADVPAEVRDMLRVIAEAVTDEDDSEPDDTDSGEDETPTAAMGLLDFEALLTGDPEPVHWLVPQVLQAGLLYQLVAAPKTGKSLLALDLAWRVAAGVDPLSGAVLPGGHTRPDGPVSVLYLDAENARRIIGDRLREMAVDPSRLALLHYASMPAIAPLDTVTGAAELLALAREVDARLIIIDTVSRFVGGNENDSQTYLDLYRLALAPLKREGRTVVRIDHVGKDPSLGARGSSAKSGDVDVSWILTKGQTPARFRLTCEFDRTADHPQELTLRRRGAPLRHEVAGKTSLADLDADELADVEQIDPRVAEAVAELDRCKVPAGVGKVAARTALVSAGSDLKIGNADLQAACNVRRAREGLTDGGEPTGP